MLVIHFAEGLSLAEYLTKEQELVKDVKEPTLFTWIVEPTVIYGRHQNAEVEVNEDYCRAHGIAVVQRKSGGGCVYADRGNLMISVIEPKKTDHSVDSVQNTDQNTFERVLAWVCKALQAKGIEAVTTEHNDILVGGRKISGWACYTTTTGTIVHGTMLYDVNFEDLQQAITPTKEKLNKHGVASVRQRVANLNELTDAFSDIHELRAYIEAYGNQFTCAIDAGVADS